MPYFHCDTKKWKKNIRNFQPISFHLELQMLTDKKKSDKKSNL